MGGAPVGHFTFHVSLAIWTLSRQGVQLRVEHLGTNFSEILIKIYTFSCRKMHLKMSSGKWRLFCFDHNVLNQMLMTYPLQQDIFQCYHDISGSGYAITHLQGCVCLWNFFLNIRLEILPSDSFMPLCQICTFNFQHVLSRHLIGEILALQLPLV